MEWGKWDIIKTKSTFDFVRIGSKRWWHYIEKFQKQKHLKFRLSERGLIMRVKNDN